MNYLFWIGLAMLLAPFILRFLIWVRDEWDFAREFFLAALIAIAVFAWFITGIILVVNNI